MRSEHKIGSQIYYNIPILLGGFFPWSVFLPFGLWYAFKKVFDRKTRSSEERRGMIFFLIWFFSIFLFFTASSTKFTDVHIPMLHIGCYDHGGRLDGFLRSAPDLRVERWMKISYYALLAIVACGVTGAWIYLAGHYPSLLKSVAISCSVLIFGMALSLAAFFNGKKIWTLILIAYSMMLFMYPSIKLNTPGARWV